MKHRLHVPLLFTCLFITLCIQPGTSYPSAEHTRPSGRSGHHAMLRSNTVNLSVEFVQEQTMADNIFAEYKFANSYGGEEPGAPTLKLLNGEKPEFKQISEGGEQQYVALFKKNMGITLQDDFFSQPKASYAIELSVCLSDVQGYKKLIGFSKAKSKAGLYVKDGYIVFLRGSGEEVRSETPGVPDEDTWVTLGLSRLEDGNVEVSTESGTALKFDDNKSKDAVPSDGTFVFFHDSEGVTSGLEIQCNDMIFRKLGSPMGGDGNTATNGTAHAAKWGEPILKNATSDQDLISSEFGETGGSDDLLASLFARYDFAETTECVMGGQDPIFFKGNGSVEYTVEDVFGHDMPVAKFNANQGCNLPADSYFTKSYNAYTLRVVCRFDHLSDSDPIRIIDASNGTTERGLYLSTDRLFLMGDEKGIENRKIGPLKPKQWITLTVSRQEKSTNLMITVNDKTVFIEDKDHAMTFTKGNVLLFESAEHLRANNSAGEVAMCALFKRAGTAAECDKIIPGSMNSTYDITQYYGYYSFDGNLESASGDEAPPLESLAGTPTYAIENLDGRMVGDMIFQKNEGFSFTDEYFAKPFMPWTMLITYQVEKVNGYRRLVDFSNGESENGLYILDQHLAVFPKYRAKTGPPIGEREWTHVIVTKNEFAEITIYENGEKILFFEDDVDRFFTAKEGKISFFNGPEAEPNCASAGKVSLVIIDKKYRTEEEIQTAECARPIPKDPAKCTLLESSCQNNGTIVGEGINCHCQCVNGWEGIGCHECGVVEANCTRHGVYHPENCTCICDDGWLGQNCHIVDYTRPQVETLTGPDGHLYEVKALFANGRLRTTLTVDPMKDMGYAKQETLPPLEEPSDEEPVGMDPEGNEPPANKEDEEDKKLDKEPKEVMEPVKP